jgi:uncharacterized protein YdeI (YjbR/CyaY-like superfamily)
VDGVSPSIRGLTFFDGPAAWRAWLEEHHADATEMWVGFYKKSTGKATLTWPQAVDEALCFGWIDGIRKSVDDETFTNRFTPRKPTSNWSAINVSRVAVLEAEGRMRDPGRAAFAARRGAKTGVYSYEQAGEARLEPAEEAAIRADAAAWAYWEARPPSYRKSATMWILTAKQPETRARRLATLIACSAEGLHVPPFRRAEVGVRTRS